MRGDLHRHTELSTDGGGRNDGSLVDFFRYMIDAADMDFGAITDHNAGGDNEYWWWYINKLTDVYFVPGRYTPLFGYERSATYPNGHRNIIHPYRNIPIVKFHFRGDVPEYWSTYEAVSRDMVDNETQAALRPLRRTGGIAISHTSATNMGTDWRDNDKEMEPVVEIYQGAATNYEHEGAPRSVKPPGARSRRRASTGPKGCIWNAWKKGYRLGVEASSDHGSTHISYSMVVTDKPTRTGIMDAIRKRHTYAATDNIILEFWMGDHFMGDEFSSSTVPPMRIKVRGTAKVAKVSIVRNAKYVYEVEARPAGGGGGVSRQQSRGGHQLLLRAHRAGRRSDRVGESDLGDAVNLLRDFRTMRNHAGREKCLGYFAFTSQCESGKFLVPLSRRHIGIGVQPILQFVEIGNRNSTFTKTIDKMFHEERRRLLNFRHSGTVCGRRSAEALRSGDGVHFRSWLP